MLAGSLAGAAVGAAEMACQLLSESDPSVVRRAAFLLSYSTILYAVCFALLCAFAILLVRLGGARGWPAATRKPQLLLTGSALGVLLAALLISYEGSVFWGQPAAVRIGLLALSLAASLLAGRLVARNLIRREGGAIDRGLAAVFRSGRIAALSAAVAALLLGAGILLFSSPGKAEETRSVGSVKPAVDVRHGARDSAGPPNVILLVADTLRPDTLGCYGASGRFTPNIDRLASKGVLFEHVLAASSWTLPSMVSLLTSSYPHQHGFIDFDSVMTTELESLPKALSRAGYHCQAVIGNPLLSWERGFAQGFDLYDVYNYRLESHLLANRVFAGLLRLSGLIDSVDRLKSPVLWIDPGRFPFIDTRLSFYVHDEELNRRLARSGSFHKVRPEFVTILYVAPHSPYLRHPYTFLKGQPPFQPGNEASLKALYAGEVSYLDGVVGNLLETLEREGVLDNAYVVFTADHGEEFLEHGRWEHGHSLYQEVLSVPLLISGPGLRGATRIGDRVELLDVAPTLLDLVGATIPSSYGGRSLAGLLRGTETSLPPTPMFSELSSRYLNPLTDYRAAIVDQWKIIRARGLDGRLLREEIFDLATDPQERNTLKPPPRFHQALGAVLDLFEQASTHRKIEPLSEEELKKMRALGYLQQ